jgi:pilus assembly protein CpaE
MTVCLLGTKGGTGTTSMTVNIGAEVRRLAARPTVLVDLKPAPGDVALFLGLRPRFTLTQVLDRRLWREPDLVYGCVSPHACGLDVLAAGDEWGRPSARDAEGVEATLSCLRTTHAHVLIDTGSSLSPAVTTALQAADLVVLVANPDVACLRHLPRLSDAVRMSGVPPDRLRLLLNRASEYGAVSVGQIEQALGRTVDWSVPSDYRTMAAAMTSGVPVRGLRALGLVRQLEQVAAGITGVAGDDSGGRRHTSARPDTERPDTELPNGARPDTPTGKAS